MPRPIAPHAFAMTWRDGLFVHWPVDPDDLRPHVPEPLEIDTRDGDAWVSVLPFVLARAGVRCSPRFSRFTFPELNLRTYVRLDGDPGLYFFDIDVGDALLARLVRAATRLPVHRADMTRRVDGDRTVFRSDRRGPDGARFAASYRPTGEVYRADPESIDHWLVERRRLFAPEGPGILYAEISHEPWRLRPAEVSIEENSVLDARGLPSPAGDPRVLYAGRLPMTGSVVRRLGRE